jgi:hypothetical protein
MRKKAEAEQSAESSRPGGASGVPPSGGGKTWAMLIKRVYEIDPMACPRCGTEMKVVTLTT